MLEFDDCRNATRCLTFKALPHPQAASTCSSAATSSQEINLCMYLAFLLFAPIFFAFFFHCLWPSVRLVDFVCVCAWVWMCACWPRPWQAIFANSLNTQLFLSGYFYFLLYCVKRWAFFLFHAALSQLMSHVLGALGTERFSLDWQHASNWFMTFYFKNNSNLVCY